MANVDHRVANCGAQAGIDARGVGREVGGSRVPALVAAWRLSQALGVGLDELAGLAAGVPAKKVKVRKRK